MKESYNLEREYEIYVETEKKYHSWSKKWFQPADRMEIVADKLRKAEDLNDKDLRAWVSYNFLALPTEEQDKIKQLSER